MGVCSGAGSSMYGKGLPGLLSPESVSGRPQFTVHPFLSRYHTEGLTVHWPVKKVVLKVYFYWALIKYTRPYVEGRITKSQARFSLPSGAGKSNSNTRFTWWLKHCKTIINHPYNCNFNTIINSWLIARWTVWRKRTFVVKQDCGILCLWHLRLECLLESGGAGSALLSLHPSCQVWASRRGLRTLGNSSVHAHRATCVCWVSACIHGPKATDGILGFFFLLIWYWKQWESLLPFLILSLQCCWACTEMPLVFWSDSLPIEWIGEGFELWLNNRGSEEGKGGKLKECSAGEGGAEASDRGAGSGLEACFMHTHTHTHLWNCLYSVTENAFQLPAAAPIVC